MWCGYLSSWYLHVFGAVFSVLFWLMEKLRDVKKILGKMSVCVCVWFVRTKDWETKKTRYKRFHVIAALSHLPLQISLPQNFEDTIEGLVCRVINQAFCCPFTLGVLILLVCHTFCIDIVWFSGNVYLVNVLLMFSKILPIKNLLMRCLLN